VPAVPAHPDTDSPAPRVLCMPWGCPAKACMCMCGCFNSWASCLCMSAGIRLWVVHVCFNEPIQAPCICVDVLHSIACLRVWAGAVLPVVSPIDERPISLTLRQYASCFDETIRQFCMRCAVQIFSFNPFSSGASCFATFWYSTHFHCLPCMQLTLHVLAGHFD